MKTPFLCLAIVALSSAAFADPITTTPQPRNSNPHKSEQKNDDHRRDRRDSRHYSHAYPIYYPVTVYRTVYTQPVIVQQPVVVEQQSTITTYCRPFSLLIDGETIPGEGAACRQSDGSWKIMQE